jgi:Flp pilus assembly protein TadD
MAINDFNLAIKLDGKNPKFYNNRALVFLRAGHFDRAIDNYNDCLAVLGKSRKKTGE